MHFLLLILISSLIAFPLLRTSFRHVPVIDGKELDLYQLYWAVTAQGGFETVSLVHCLPLYYDGRVESPFRYIT